MAIRLDATVPEPAADRARHGARVLLVAGLLALVAALGVGCGSGTPSGGATGSTTGPGGTADPDATASAPCPVAPVQVVVSVNQWGDLVRRLAGSCATVTTIVDGSSGDPHDFEPTPADSAAIDRAALVVVNGGGYDTWATKAVAARSDAPVVVDAAAVVALPEGGNPHLWYRPAAIDEVGRRVTDELGKLLPGAETYLAGRSTAWHDELAPYRAAIDEVRATADGAPYAATESVFDELAAAVGLQDRTPDGYRQAAANESDPSPSDVNAFQRALRDRQVDVLVVNVQTEGAIPEQLRATAEEAGVPVLEVTETQPPDQPSFVAWQVDQLHRLAAALAPAGRATPSGPGS